MNRVAIAGIVVMSAAFANQGMAQALDRTKRPVIDPAPPFVFPKMETQRLSNGLQIVVIENHSVPLVAVRAVVGADSLDDPLGKEGLFALTSAMLSEGTTTRSASQIASEIATLGSAVTPTRFTTIPQSLGPSLELMADMLANPTFPDSALTRLKVALASAKQRELQIPSTIPNGVFLARLFGERHQIARAVHATDASINGITRDDLVRFHATYFRAKRATLVVVGDTRASDVVALAAKAFAVWKDSSESPFLGIPVYQAPATTIYLVDRPGAQQSYVFVGALGPVRNSNDFAALETMGPILGSSASSRLLSNLRERHGFVYAGTPFTAVWRRPPFRSQIGGSAAVATAKIDSALVQWLGELRGMVQRPPTAEEMTLARAWLVDALPAQIETVDLIANRVMSMIQTGTPLDFYNSYGRRIETVTPAEISAAAAKYIDMSHLVIVVAGDRKIVEPLLRAANIAPIVIVDETGKS